MPYLRLLGPVSIDPLQGLGNHPDNPNEERSIAGLPRFRSRRTVALLGYLAAERRPLSRDYLAPFFWPDESLSKSRASLRRELYNLGQILPNCWEMDRQMVSFVPCQKTFVDLYALPEFIEQASWAEAADLVRGEFLEGLYLEQNAEFELWLLTERDRWRQLGEEALSHLIRGLIRRGHYNEALRHTHRLLILSPWNENAYQIAMRLLTWTGQRGAALRQFNTCQHYLQKELNIEPADETLALYQQIKEGDLAPPPQIPAFLTEEEPRHNFQLPPFVGCESEIKQLDDFLLTAFRGQGQVVFITGGPGRGKTALLDNFAQEAMRQNPNLLVASGKCDAYSGRGDPFLPFRILTGMLTGDIENLWDAGAISREHARRLWSALPSVIQALLDHGRQLIDTLVPGEDLLSRASSIEGSDAPWIPQLRECITRHGNGSDIFSQNYLFQQVSRLLFAITKSHPLMIILDDLQWADPASISLLFHLGRSLVDQDARLLVACAYRPEEVGMRQFTSSTEPAEQHSLTKLLNEFKRSFGDIWIDLSRPKEAGGAVFIDALLDIEPNCLSDEFRQELCSRTGGHPLFTVELLQAMKEQGGLLLDKNKRWVESSALDWDHFPARVEAVIEDRINRLDPALQEMLEVASIEGEEFTTQILTKYFGMSENVVLRKLSQTLKGQHRLVKEGEEIYTRQGRISRFRFGHALFQVYLYNRLSAGEQRLLHGQVAKYLEELHNGQEEKIAGQLAQHYHKAEDLDRACEYYALAAERATRLYANDEAKLHYSQAIQLAERIPAKEILLAELYRMRGLVLEQMGELDHALADHNISLKIAQSLDDPDLEWICLLNLGRLWASRDYQRTHDYFQRAIKLAREQDDPLALASSMNWLGNWHMNMELPEEATSYHLEALEIAERLNNQQELANTLDLLGILKMMEGKQRASKEYYDRAIRLQREMEDQVRLVTSLAGRAGSAMTLAFLATFPYCSIDQATDDLLEALQFAEETGSIAGKSWTLFMQGILGLVQGQFGLSRTSFLTGLQLATDVNHYEYMIGNHFGVGALYLELLDPEQARFHGQSGLSLAEELHSQAMINYSAAVLAGAYLQLDDSIAAKSCLEKVLPLAAPMDTVGKRYCWIREVEVALACEDPDQGLEITERLIRSIPDLRPEQVITYLWKLKADALTAMDKAEEALPLLVAALENALENSEVFLVWKLHASLSKVYRELGHESQADHQLQKGQDQIRSLADSISDEKLRNQYHQSASARLIAVH